MTGAVIVLYNFELAKVTANILKLSNQADLVCLIDNSSTDSTSHFQYAKIHYIPLLHNMGIAYAQNVGITYLIQQGCKYIIFCDDDSDISVGMLSGLRHSFLQLQQSGVNVGGIAPRAYNRQTGMPYPYPCNKVGEYNLGCHRYTEVTDLISSGTLTTTDVFTKVGLMEETLFIDGVDSEWCWRGRALGYRFFVDESIRLDHLMGLGTRNVAGRYISVTPPYRMYYMYRNYLRLIRRGYTPLRWKWYNGFKYLAKAIYYPLSGKNAKEYLVNILKGIRDS